MDEVAHRKVEEIDAIGGVLPGIQMHRVAADLDVGAFGISITLIADGEEYPLDPDHIAKVPPEVSRKVIAGPQGLRLLALGGTAGQAYLSGGTL